VRVRRVQKNNEVGTNAVPYLRPRSYLSPFNHEKEAKLCA